MALSAAALASLQARLDLYYAAEVRLLAKQSYRLPDGRELAYTNLKWVQEMIATLEAKINAGSQAPVAIGRARRGVVR